MGVGFELSERITGTYYRLDDPFSERSIRIALRLRVDGIRKFARGRTVEAEGMIFADTFASARAGGAPIKARVRELSPAADPATRTYPARVALLDPPPNVALGMTATVVLTSPVRQALLLPLQAILLEGGSPQVWLFDAASSQVARRAVKVGGVAGNEIAVVDGIKPGDVVVTAGVHLLKDGQKVKLLGATPGAAPAKGANHG